jgi:para-nitrobenzyl esterase
MTTPVAQTAHGAVSGARERGVLAFRGVPYGATTEGRGRFRPASPPSWTGTRDATTFGPTAPPGLAALGVPDEHLGLFGEGMTVLPSPGEDCLVLNVWTSALDAGTRPVMVWLHGGGFTGGSGTSYDGAGLASRGDVVVVTLNHRLGLLGFLYLDRLAPDLYAGSGLVGMLDIVTALEWIRDNIGRFGGDPSNVTVFGYSGGGLKVSTLLAMPAAHGLFHKAIVQSGPYLRAVDPDRATEVAERVLTDLGLTTGRIAELHDVPLGSVMQSQANVVRELEARPAGYKAGVTASGTLWELGPVVDGVGLPQHPFDPAASPLASDVPVIIGHNRHEAAMFLLSRYANDDDVTADELRRVAGVFRGDIAADLVALYARTRPTAKPSDLLDALIATDAMWLDSVRLAERKAAGGSSPVFMYQFAYESDVLGGRLGAGHGMEVPFVFDDVETAPTAGTRPDRFELARVMSEAWVRFATYGDPNHPGLPTWTPYSAADRSAMVFDSPCRNSPDPTELREGLTRLGIRFNR